MPGRTYTLRFKNRSGSQHDFLVYQVHVNPEQPDVQSLAWFAKPVAHGADVDFTWTTDLGFIWVERGVLASGITFKAAQFLPADLQTANLVPLTYQDGAFRFGDVSGDGPKGNLTIKCDETIPPNVATVGVGMAGAPTFWTIAAELRHRLRTASGILDRRRLARAGARARCDGLGRHQAARVPRQHLRDDRDAGRRQQVDARAGIGVIARMKTICVAAVLTAGAAVCLSAPARAQCVPTAIPPGWLNAQEAAGGHTIARHVGQTLQQLINRIFNGGVPPAGSYPTVSAAQFAITTALTANAATINNWRASGGIGGGPVYVGSTQVFNYANAANIGTVAFTVGNPPNAVGWSQTCALTIVMRATRGNTCLLLTSYPRQATPNDHCR